MKFKEWLKQNHPTFKEARDEDRYKPTPSPADDDETVRQFKTNVDLALGGKLYRSPKNPDNVWKWLGLEKDENPDKIKRVIDKYADAVARAEKKKIS